VEKEDCPYCEGFGAEPASGEWDYNEYSDVCPECDGEGFVYV
jgi:DnaJ-class molecular chaperone